MNGPEIFAFTLRVVPQVIRRLLAKAAITIDSVDYFVFHQANEFMLEHLRNKLCIPKEKFCVAMRDCGNTVSCTIHIALREAQDNGCLRPGMLVMLVGFGVGYSWGACLVRWS
jgi:3-oxoacyl-[acyl-carrier-protein] synthase-3